MIVDKVFEHLRQRDNTLSKSRFAVDYLGKDRSYLFVKKHRQQDISNDALLRLYGELVGSHAAYEQLYEQRDLAHSENAAYRRDFEASQQLCEELLIEIKHRAMNVV